MKFFILILTIGCVFCASGTARALCVDYDGDGNCDATGSVGDVPMPSNPTPVDTGSGSSRSPSTATTTRATSSTKTVHHSSVPSTESMVAPTVVGSVMGAVLGDLFSSPAPAGPTPEELEAQRKLEEQKRLEFQRSNAALAGKLKGSGSMVVEDKDISESGGLKLKTIPAATAQIQATTGGGDVHSRLFGEGSADPAKVGLLREPMPSAQGLSDPVAWKNAISRTDLTQEERERLMLQRQVPPTALDDHPMVDSRAFVEKERWTDPYLDIAMAGAKAGATTVGGGVIEEGGKRYLKALGGAETGYDELLTAGKAGIDRPATTADKVFAVGDYALTKAPSWTTAVDGAANAVGAGTRQAIVRCWAAKDSKQYYDPTPVATAKGKWNSWYDGQNEWTQAALNRVGAGEFKE